LSTALYKVKESPTENNKRMLAQIKDTCIKIILSSKVFRADLVDKIVKFATLGAKESQRTADKIKGIKVLLAQLYCLMSINNVSTLIDDENHKAIFSDATKLNELKKNLVRFAMEEQLRRHLSQPEKIIDNIIGILYPKY